MLALTTVAADFLLGLRIGDFNSAAKRYVYAAREQNSLQGRDVPVTEKEKIEREYVAAGESFVVPRRNLTFHFYIGIASSLLAILVCSICVTYFIGTSRWCKEVVETYRLSPE